MADQRRQRNVDLLAELRRLRRAASALCLSASRTEERAGTLEREVADLETAFTPECLAPKPDGLAPTPRHRAPTDSDFLLKLAAQAGVEKVELKWLADGAALVRVEGGKDFPLPPALAVLLKILAFKKPVAEDHLVAWKSRDEVHARFQKQTGRKVEPHAIDGLLTRLRHALVSGGVNHFFVQTHRRFGLRFALRRSGTFVES